ncbi:MAG: homoserine dehydrogenase [Cyanobacteria bacterium]|nr:homoserine dehydrogenase [Cyanobacteriota bacterium]
MTSSSISVGMIGFGTVGTGVVRVLQKFPSIQFSAIAVQNLEKPRSVQLPSGCQLTQDAFSIVDSPTIQIVIEVMGGVDLAKDLVVRALQNKKHVVTANKELIAKHGVELFKLAQENQACLLFEGAVAGGIPIIMPLKLCLSTNTILEMAGILNGTTNYILTKMTDEGWSYQDALKEAQDKGFAESDPTNDVEGFDASYKIALLSNIAYQKSFDLSQIFCEGISQIHAMDIKNAEALGYRIKLIGLSKQTDSQQLDIRVHPMLVPHTHPLAAIKNEYNAVWVRGDAVGDVMFYGKGAGEMPTGSAVSADIVAIAQDLLNHNKPVPAMQVEFKGTASLCPIAETTNKYYIRLVTMDLPGVIGNLGKACGEFGVSLESVLQRCTHEDGRASIILVTHDVPEKQMRQALEKIQAQETTDEIACLLRVLS